MVVMDGLIGQMMEPIEWRPVPKRDLPPKDWATTGRKEDVYKRQLESCPVAGSDFEFVFFLELDASVQDPSVLAMLEEMERSCAEFQFLGNYAEV